MVEEAEEEEEEEEGERGVPDVMWLCAVEQVHEVV